MSLRVCNNFKYITVHKRLIDRCISPINMYECEMIANIGVNMISKINGTGSSGECDNFSFWGEYKNLVIKYLCLHLIEECCIVLSSLQDIFDFAHPHHIIGNDRASFFGVLKVCCYSDFCMFMHFSRSYLDFCWLCSVAGDESYNGCME